LERETPTLKERQEKPTLLEFDSDLLSTSHLATSALTTTLLLYFYGCLPTSNIAPPLEACLLLPKWVDALKKDG
jgi:hypothetical protein